MKHVVLTPSYMNDFTCIGSKCEDSCCAGWTVTIDEETYKKYKRVKNFELTPLINKNITRIRSNPNKANYAKIKMSHAKCPFLNEEQLCKIQKNLGEQYLSNTCSSYPRMVNRVNQSYERSGVTSCPEIARLALLNQDGITFDELLEPIHSINPLTVAGTIGNELNKSHNQMQDYLWDMRFFVIELLQNRKLELTERLMILGLFMSKVQNLQDENRNAEVKGLISSFSSIYEDPALLKELQGIQSNNAIQMQLLKDLVDDRICGGIINRRYAECFAEFLLGVNYGEEMTVPQIAEYYQELYQNLYAPFNKKYEYILENYVVNYVFSKLFPVSSKRVFDDFSMLIIHYALIKLHLIGMMGYHQENFNVEHVIKLIQSFSKVVEHNKLYLYNVQRLLKENKMDTLAYMIILIKN